jgi:4-amino-4-deoxy-L-arabinose transferase-like glycosyltransferase
MLNFFPAAITMRLFGADLVGLNASGVIEGLLTILGVYLLGTELFNKRVGLLAAALLLVSYAHLAASRQSGYIDPVFYMTYATYFGVAGLKRQEGGPMLASGFFSALCLQSYWSGRLIIPLFAVVLLGLLVFQRSWLFSRRWQLLLWGIAVLVTTGPMLLVFARQPTPLTSHAQQISLFSPRIMGHMQSVYRVDTQEEVLFEQARRTVFALHYYPDTGTQFSFRRPFLDCITASLFTLGCGFMLFRLRNPGAAMLLAWMLLGTVFGIFLGENPPYWGRLMILLPAIAVIAATSLDATSRFLERTLPVRRRATELTMAAAALLLFVYLGVSNWQTYVNVSATYATPRARIGRYLAQLPDAENAHLVTSLGWRIDELEFEFLAPGRLSRSLAPEELQHLLSAGALDGVLILTGELTEVANALPSVLPGGALAAIAGNTEGEVAFYVYRIP